MWINFLIIAPLKKLKHKCSNFLQILGKFSDFESAVKTVIAQVHFDTDVSVSVFEANIRMLGGLLSAHILAENMNWYNGELLQMADDLGTRLLPWALSIITVMNLLPSAK